ncbi:MAG: hypothetical protein AAGA11_18565 [Pseudomonadota bacterium]
MERDWIAIEVGVGPGDAGALAEGCDDVSARATACEPGFKPPFFTPRGGFASLRALAWHVWGSDELRGRRVAVHSLGQTGGDLACQLLNDGAEPVFADVRETAARDAIALRRDSGCAEAIHAHPADLFVPCALGGVISDRTVPERAVRGVCGLANNQLAEPRHGAALAARGLVYVLDHVVNAGGMMGASTAVLSEVTRAESPRRIDGLYDTILSILETARATGVPPSDVADAQACERLPTPRAEPDCLRLLTRTLPCRPTLFR